MLQATNLHKIKSVNAHSHDMRHDIWIGITLYTQ